MNSNYKPANIVIFTPTYNEADNIEIFVKQVFEVLPQCKILVVDDNSPDGTAKKVEELKKDYPNLYLLVRKEKRGRGWAGIDGFKKALELKADLIVEMDADLSHSPDELPKLIHYLQNNPEIDVVVGSRYIKGGEDSERNIIRKFISLFARTYIKIVTGIPLKDITSGYKVYRREVIEKILPFLAASDPFIVTEVNYLCKLYGFKFQEIPIKFHKRLYGKSKLSLGKLLKYLFKVWILTIKWFLKDNYNKNFLKLLIVSTLIRLLILDKFGLTDDEAHYWQYSQHLDFSYYDHPGMVGYLIYLSTKIFGNTLYGVRLPALVCFFVASFYFYKLVKEIFNSKIAFRSTLLLNLIPIAFVGSIITLPDAPVGMFWMAYLFYFYKFVITKDSLLLYLCGAILGLAFISKYNAVFLLIGSLIIFVFNSELRRFFIKKDFYIYLIITFVFSSPLVLWNIAHNFVSFQYQFLNRIHQKNFFSIITFFENFGYQSAYISPIVFLLLWYAIIYVILNYRRDFKYNFFLYFSLPGIILFNIVAIKNKILPHWPAISYFTVIPLLISIDRKKVFYTLSWVSSLIITISVVIITIFGFIHIPEKYHNADTPDKLYGWDKSAEELNRLIKEYSNSFIFTHKYYVAGQIRFGLARYYPDGNIPEVFCIDDYLNQYDFWSENLQSYDGKDAIYVTEGRFPEDEVLKELPFEKIELLSIVSFKKSRYWPVRKFKFFICRKFNYKNLQKKFIQDSYNNYVPLTQFYKEYDKKFFLKINQSSLYGSKIFRANWYFLTNLGNGFVLIPLMVVILYFIDKKNFVKNLISFLIIVSFGGILIQLLKNIFNKPRPLKLFYDILNQSINVIGEQLREYGFPSGHTFIAFSTAIFLMDRIKKPILNAILFVLALLVGISRVFVGAHFLSDVIGGMIFAIIFTNICLKIEKEIS